MSEDRVPQDDELSEEISARDIDGAFLASGGIDRARAAVSAGELPELDRDGLRIGPPVTRPATTFEPQN